MADIGYVYRYYLVELWYVGQEVHGYIYAGLSKKVTESNFLVRFVKSLIMQKDGLHSHIYLDWSRSPMSTIGCYYTWQNLWQISETLSTIVFEHITDSITSLEAVELRKLLTCVSDMILDLRMFYFPRDIVQDERELTPEHDTDYVQRFEVW